MRRLLTVVFAGWIMSGCQAEVRQPVELVRFDFSAAPESTVVGPSFGGPAPLAAFTENFSPPGGHGRWTLGERATAQFYVVGQEVELSIALSTNPELSAKGQSVILRWNDHEIGGMPLDRGWEIHADTLQVPDSIVEQGWNRLSILPERFNRGEVADARPLGVFLRRVSLHSQATERDLARRRALLGADELVDEWSYGHVEVDRVRPASARGFAGAMSKPAPDVMILLMDAARADHFSSYGYERETTPFVDRLASEGVRWSNAQANAPFTPISVATLMTGLPWRDHRVSSAETALSQEHVTMAEMFRNNGYETIAFSDNPYVNGSTGLAQGFDEFVAVRTHPRQVEYRKTVDTSRPDWVQHRPAEMVSWLFDERVARGIGPEAHFLYLHIMPPHSPYVPGTAHDLWSDPSYRGDINGSPEQLEEIKSGKRELSATDRQHLIDLYDGNLHRADAVARALFEKWQSLDRGRELLVVVLSDHGEAFGEHGEWEHLTDVHREMLHVPAVFWPRGAWAELEEHANDLHGLGEIMPMLLSKAKVPLPPGSTWPAYFRRAYQGPGESRRENLLVRSYALTNRFGVLSGDELLVYDGRGRQQLYDLRQDPQQESDSRWARADHYSRRLASLIRALERAPAGPPAAATAYSKEDLEALKAIGYAH